MYLSNNPVLQHELLANLRMPRAFLLLAAYVGLLGVVVMLAWPQAQKVDLAQPEEAKRLVNLFFLGQYMLASLMAPSFAAGAITGEKERLSFEMLLASPLRPGAIVLGKLLAALTHLGILMLCSLPIVMLCLPLGGVSAYEVFAAYFAMISSVALFGVISLWASSMFQRTSASLVVSYLLILPLAMLGVLMWNALGRVGELRLIVILLFFPAVCLALSTVLWRQACLRLLYPSDLGSGGAEVVDLEAESQKSVGLYIKRDEFPDRLFAPPKRTTFIEDGVNPIYDKEMRSEIFAQGTLMLRVVIQVSMALAIPIMACTLYIWPQYAAWYIAYVILFNTLVGPVFSAGSVCSERERQTLDLLLVTLITPWQMMWGKLLSGLRVSSVLTGFLLWPVMLACVMPRVGFLTNLPTMFGYMLIVAFTCLTTAMTALAASTLFRKSSTALIASYLVVVTLFAAPVAARYFADTFFRNTPAAATVEALQSTSPLAAAFALPLSIERGERGQVDPVQAAGEPYLFFGFLGWSLLYNLSVLALVVWLFRSRWRVAE